MILTNKLTSLTLLSVLLTSANLPFDCFANDLSPFVSLSHTDGHQLPRKLPVLDKKQQQLSLEQRKNSCQSECVTPFGELLGKADGIEAFSNCRSTCIKPEYSFLNLTTKQVVTGNSNPDEARFHYIGVVHQCVEYARKWWMINNGVTFGSIDSAFEIIYLTEGKNIYTNQTFPLGRSINGSASRAPARGDLLIYSADRSQPNWQHGHVAVVVDVDLKAGNLFVAEENYNNRHWQKLEQYSRKIRISKTDKGYQVDDVDPNQKDLAKLGHISGWIYPLNLANQ